ncbi:DUF402 domain-containing protein [Bacillus niameyensis]|uniref:DUF402 domain-containing protein n=1 Tax=Bacillus niameyensis TaxID=1522308 RepID=UPI0007850D19|nr:DUF402 domain-containing protein [Bacillus niameyensis]
MKELYFTPGDQVVLRRVWHDKICRVTAATVVQDTSELIVLYWGPGYPLKVMQNPLKGNADKSSDDLRDVTWGEVDVVMLATPGAGHAVYAMRNEEESNIGCWYINLQEPLLRTPIGFDTMDYLLDINVSPDRSEWYWKDETDFADAVQSGKISPAKAQAIRAEGERAIKLLQEGPSTFYDGWANWFPPKDWEIPKLPLDWEKIF